MPVLTIVWKYGKGDFHDGTSLVVAEEETLKDPSALDKLHNIHADGIASFLKKRGIDLAKVKDVLPGVEISLDESGRVVSQDLQDNDVSLRQLARFVGMPVCWFAKSLERRGLPQLRARVAP